MSPVAAPGRRWQAGLVSMAIGCLAATLAGCGSAADASGNAPVPPAAVHAGGAAVPSWEWPTYAHDAQHTGHGQTLLTAKTVKTLSVAWSFPTGDAVTATPTVVGGTVYVGSWDGWFYAVDLETGVLRWKYQLQAQDAVTPYPGEVPRDMTSDGGLVTSSAWYESGAPHVSGDTGPSRPDLVIFGAGYTLYALDAHTGHLFWMHDYTGRPGLPPDPNNDGTRIFSSPVVVAGSVLFGVDTDGQKNSRGYAVSASLATGDPIWEYQDDVDTSGHILDNGCGNIWSSGTVLPAAGLVVFDSADCAFADPPPTSESVFALHLATGKLAWRYRPRRAATECDLDFGGTPNAGITAGGEATFLGAGSKDGTYYSLDPVTGRLRWSTNVVFGGFSGGFVATAAYDGNFVYGSTALGDAGRFERGSQVHCDPGNPKDTTTEEPSVHAFEAGNGRVRWQASRAGSFAATTVAGGMTFNCPAFGAVVQVRSAGSGSLVDQAPIPASCWSGIATVGDSLVLGIGSTYQGSPAGIVVLTPGGKRPVVPASR
ncbi:MAG: PQQ-binding-like beta-propeller repeat protein [Acidimicrobiales bacterium]